MNFLPWTMISASQVARIIGMPGCPSNFIIVNYRIVILPRLIHWDLWKDEQNGTVHLQ
jgi:hypothetical protein